MLFYKENNIENKTSLSSCIYNKLTKRRNKLIVYFKKNLWFIIIIISWMSSCLYEPSCLNILQLPPNMEKAKGGRKELGESPLYALKSVKCKSRRAHDQLQARGISTFTASRELRK